MATQSKAAEEKPVDKKPKTGAKPAEAKAGGGNGKAAAVDPLQWWGSLTQQFQEIASNAMKDVAQKAAATPAKGAARPAKKSAARKSAPRKAAAS